MEPLRDAHGLLADHGIHDQQRFRWPGDFAHPLQLVHQIGIDLQTAGGVEDEDTVPIVARFLDRPRGDLSDVLLTALRVNRHADLLAQRLELIDRGRPLDVQRSQHGRAALAHHPLGQLGRRGRLARSLQPRQQDHGRRDRRDLHRLRLAAQQLHQLVVHNLDDLLPWCHRLEDLLPRRLFLDAAQKVLGYLEIDVCFQQNAPDFAQSLPDHRLGQQSARAEAAENGVQFF